jgi:hypothetical protein
MVFFARNIPVIHCSTEGAHASVRSIQSTVCKALEVALIAAAQRLFLWHPDGNDTVVDHWLDGASISVRFMCLSQCSEHQR